MAAAIKRRTSDITAKIKTSFIPSFNFLAS